MNKYHVPAPLIALLALCSVLPLRASAAFPEDNLVAYYTFQGSLINQVGGGFNGTGVGGLTYGSDRFGNTNASLTFTDGAYMTVSATPFNVNGDYTVSLWMFGTPGAPDPVQQIFATGIDIQGGLTLRYGTVGGYGFVSGWYGGDPDPPAGFGGGLDTPFQSQWNQLVLTRSGNSTDLYLNGILLGGLATTPTASDTGTLQFGWYQEAFNSYNLQGSLDDIRIYDQSFTASEVSQLYAIESVPEPSTYALLGIGVMVALYFGKKRIAG